LSLQELAGEVVRLALNEGATDAECTISEGEEFSANVRMGEVESLKEAGARGAGVRVLKGKRSGSAYTSDLSRDGIARMVSSALELAAITSEDPHAGLPEASELGAIDGDLALYCDDVAQLETPFKIEQARQAEKAALDFDRRIANSEGASFDSHAGARYFANSRGFSGSYRSSSCSMSAVPVASDGEKMERDYWFSVARSYSRLEEPDYIGRKAAERALRRLGARKVPTQRVPWYSSTRTREVELDHIIEAVSGDSIYRKASFLTDKIGEQVAAEQLTVIDDGTIPGLFGTSPFDDEGVPSRRTAVIERGVLKSYLLNSYTARKLGLKTTGNAARGLSGNAGIGHGNLFIGNGAQKPQDILRSIKQGLYVTELIGFGVNIVTGD